MRDELRMVRVCGDGSDGRYWMRQCQGDEPGVEILESTWEAYRWFCALDSEWQQRCQEVSNATFVLRLERREAERPAPAPGATGSA